MGSLFDQVQVPTIDPDDPFGEDIHTRYLGPGTPKTGIGVNRSKSRHQVLNEWAEYGDTERTGGKPQRKKLPNFFPQVKAHFESPAGGGWWAFRVDGHTMQNGVVVARDLMGIWDVLLLKPRERAWVQICARSARAPHLRKMTGNEPAPDNKEPRIKNLVRCMKMGDPCYLALLDQPRGPGTKWRLEIEQITEDMVRAAVARKRG